MTLFSKRLIAGAVSALAITGMVSFAASADTTALCGDTNNDGVVNISDATYIQKVLIDKADKTDAYNKNGDVNLDGVIDVEDVTAIQKYLVRIYDELPIGEKPSQPATEVTTATEPESETQAPTAKPTEPASETQAPTEPVSETQAPTVKPSEVPTVKPTEAPTVQPTTAAPTQPTTVDPHATDADGWEHKIYQP